MSTPASGHVYRYRGLDANGAQKAGKVVVHDLTVWVQARFLSHWRQLSVFGGDGPVPPDPDELSPLAVIKRNANGRMVWWAEEVAE